MNQLEFQVYWKERRGQIRLRWNKLSDNDIDRVGGRYGHFVRLLEQKYGISPNQAGAEIDQWLQQPAADSPRRGILVP